MSFQFKTLYRDTRSALSENPETAVATFEAESRQTAGLRSQVAVRQFQVGVDEPAVLGGGDSAPNPVEYVLAALAACQEITYRLHADGLGIPLNGVSAKVEGDIDLRGFFAVDAGVRPGYGDIVVSVTLDSPAPAAELARLKAAVDAHCPVLDIIRNPTPVHLDLATTNSAAAAAA
ncbi:MAG: OsmC family protein [Alphaproteobacteria bacterium]|nr:OsmC family protein [Alphaproteobacteria bacterium]MDP6565624.1 OsmC family protein [Alphaproteobacteria bacterium]MDP6813239.1 OsmC family protein [Alphaproteobacteria bacterium]